MDDVFAALEATEGFIARRDLLALGLDDRFIRMMLKARQWTRVRPGAYASTRRWEALSSTERHRVLCRAVLKAHGDGVVLSHVSGLLQYPGCNVWGVDLDRVHVTRRDGRSGGLERDVVHHEGKVSDTDVVMIGGLPVLCEDRCLVEAISVAGLEPGLVMADSCFHQRRVSPQQAEERHLSSRRLGRRTVDLVLRLADGRAESPGETRSRYVFWSQGLPKPEVQFEVHDRSGLLVGVCDLAWPLLAMLFEFDGRIKYGRLLKPGEEPGDAVFREKKREDLLRRVTGFAMERATWVDLANPRELARRTRERFGGDLGA
jgi:hypothetical protein